MNAMVTMFVDTATKIETNDHAHPTLDQRVVVLRVADLTIHFSGNDEEIAATASLLQGYLESIRRAALERWDAADMERRDDQIDAGFGTGYIGEFA